MKKTLITLLAVFGLAVGLHAEGTGTKYNGGAYNTYSAYDVPDTTGTSVRRSTYLHKVIVSSAAEGVVLQSDSVINAYNSYTNAANKKFAVQTSTINGTYPQEWTFDILMSSGLFVTNRSTPTTSHASAQFIYRNAPPGGDNYKVWDSSYIVNNAAVHNLTAGPVLLHKISVMKKGTGTAILNVYDNRMPASPTVKKIAAIDLTDTAREYTFNVLCSSGITIQASGAGTVIPEFMVLYKRNPSPDWEVWRATFTTGSVSLGSAGVGSFIVGGVINGDSISGSYLDLYDSQGVASGKFAHIDGGASFDRKMYDVQTSSGLTFTSSGNGLYTILFRRK